MKYVIHSQNLREGQYELFYSIFDDNDKVVAGNMINAVGKEKLDEKGIASFMSDRIFELEHPVEIPEPEKVYTESEVEQILIDKNYLTAGQSLEDLPVKK